MESYRLAASVHATISSDISFTEAEQVIIEEDIQETENSTKKRIKTGFLKLERNVSYPRTSVRNNIILHFKKREYNII